MQTRYLISRSKGSVELATRDVEDPGPGEVVVQHRMTAMSPGTERAACSARSLLVASGRNIPATAVWVMCLPSVKE